jgi:hypothetical protein
VALEAYGFTEAHLRLIVDTDNTTYRVKTVDPTPLGGSLYVDFASIVSSLKYNFGESETDEV